MTIIGYLNQLIGEGRLRRSDVLFTVPLDKRELIAREQSKRGESKNRPRFRRSRLHASGITDDDITVVQTYGSADHAWGEMYEDIRALEIGLHNLVRAGLTKEFGDHESQWWRKGIPVQIRQKCQSRREEDEGASPAEPFSYTDLIDLKEIFDKHWKVLSVCLPDAAKRNKKTFLSFLVGLNKARRPVMHPVRGGEPSVTQFYYVRGLRQLMGF